MFYIFVDLHYNHAPVQLGYINLFFLLDTQVPHTNFNKLQPMFQSVPGNTGLTLSEDGW